MKEARLKSGFFCLFVLFVLFYIFTWIVISSRPMVTYVIFASNTFDIACVGILYKQLKFPISFAPVFTTTGILSLAAPI